MTTTKEQALRADAAGASGGTDALPSAPRVDRRNQALYESLLAGDHAAGPQGRVAFCISAATLGPGHEDVPGAVGLARALVARGWGVRFVPRSGWRRRIDEVDVVVSLLPGFDPAVVAGRIPLIAWVRGRPDAWISPNNLSLYDTVLCTSELSLEAIRDHYSGPTGLLPHGVDHELFRPAAGGRVVATTVLEDTGSLGLFALPDACARSLLVLDRTNPSTLPYGGINGRVFEALACGALPVTDVALGLAEQGLEGLPVVRSSDDLARLIQRYRDDPDAAAVLAERLRDVVLARHTFGHRADALLASVPSARQAAARQPPTIACYPYYTRNNPYQRLLYAATTAAGVRVVPVKDRATLTPRDPGGSLDGRILHVHWTYPILQDAVGTGDAYRRLDRFRQGVEDLRGRGGRLFWTVHNVLSHDCRHRTLEIELCRYLAATADVIHVLGERTAAETAPLYHLPPEKIRVIPHSSYVGVYPDFVGRAEARRRLRLLDQEIALLVFGELRPYKGLDILFPVFDKAVAADPRLRLLVAGRPDGTPRAEEWRRHCSRHPRIAAHLDFVAEADIQVWMRAADVVVLPYGSILNSGALQLALTFGRPVVAPDQGVVSSQLDSGHTAGFRPNDPVDLLRAINEAVDHLVTPEAGASALRSALRYPPAAMSADFLAVVRDQLSSRTRPWPEPA